ncbi:hypothetical protein IAU60_006634 [Kwoniella sp. DSM 27419]
MDHSGSIGEASNNKTEKIKRGYRACLHCRSRKAKCDLGDIDAPSSPPCSRCKRESRQCIFAPSRRGGNNRKRGKKEESDEMSDDDHPYENVKPEVGLVSAPVVEQPPSEGMLPPVQTFPYPYPPGTHLSPTAPRQSPQSNYFNHVPNSGSSHSNLSPMTQASTIHSPPPSRPPFPPAHSSATQHNRPDSRTSSPKRRRLHLNPPLHAADPSSIVVADMQNESDALQILALASGQAAKEETRTTKYDNRSNHANSKTGHEEPRERTGVNRHPSDIPPSRKPSLPPDLQDFCLVKLGVLSAEDAMNLTESFFRCHHHLFPMVPSAIIPRTPEQVAVFAQKERYLLAAYIIIASRPDPSPKMRRIHEEAWRIMRGWITDVQCLGAPPTIGLVEALLLLAENLPRTPSLIGPDDLAAQGCRDEPHGDENRQAWQMIGLAVRSAYEMGLDKIALRLIADHERTVEIERARLAWTYCYLFDRHVSLRLGKGFWARGAQVCFQGYSSSAQTGPAAGLTNFPFLREIKMGDHPGGDRPQEDLGAFVQAHLELTQMMSNAHDVLYPNTARTRSLVVHGEYFKYLDEMARSLDGFKLLWRHKKWTLFPLTDTMWTMYYYLQLYICAFSFQAHVERATIRAEEEYRLLQQSHREKGDTTPLSRPALSLFPRGAGQSPDARYIFHMCDAARELLHICVDNLYPGGALPYLPSRFLLWFTYGAIVLLKALYSGAMLRGDHKATLSLIDRLCECFSHCSVDEDHPAVRYGRQLEALRKKLAGLSDVAGARSPTGGRTVPLPPIKPHGQPSSIKPSWENVDPSHARAGEAHSTRPSVLSGDRMPQSSINHDYSQHTPQWQLPPAENHSQPIVFPYPSTPGPIPSGPTYPNPPHSSTIPLTTFVAPHTQQPLLDVSIPMPPQDYGLTMDLRGMGSGDATQLNFGSTDDWFGSVGLAGPGGNGNGNGSAGTGQNDGMNALAGLDLQDFWMQVGPGEAQGGFPFR